MPLTDWPAAERPREKLLAHGAEALSDAELLAIFLRTGVPGMNAVELARHLLAEHGGLAGVLRLDRRAFCARRGLGEAKYVQLQAALEIARRHLQAQLARGTAMTSPRQVRDYFALRLGNRPHEVFACLYLDTRHRVIACEELFRGTLDGASVHVREVVASALEKGASALIFAHNHPSGVAEPSAADRRITERLRQALALVDVRVLDHIVVGAGETVSFAELGLL